MNLYMDDDTASRRLVALLSNAGHGVVVPANVELSGAPDARHFIHAMRQSLVLVLRTASNVPPVSSDLDGRTAFKGDSNFRLSVLVTRNHDDFLDLHEVVQVAHGTHPGILIVRFENDPTRDMTPRQIVTAISRLESATVPLQNQVYILNHWR